MKITDQESLVETQPTHPNRDLESFQPIHFLRSQTPPDTTNKPGKNHSRRFMWFLFLFLGVVLGYFFLPIRTNILILGVDSGLGRGELGRTDTIVLTTISPPRPYIGLLSIPRDLWVKIPGENENRINTAYFYAEAKTAGSGAQATQETIRDNFGVSVDYSVILSMDGLVGLVDSFDGLDVTLPVALSGYQAGSYHFDGTTALAFVRSRAGSDDFSRMKQGQILAQAALRKLLTPSVWAKYPQIFVSMSGFIKSNIPVWQWPRLGLALLRSSLVGVDSKSITREMVTPFVTSGGAQVLGPNWEAINPVLDEMFGK